MGRCEGDAREIRRAEPLTLSLSLTLALTLTREEGCRVAHITSGRERRLRGGDSEALGHA